MGACLQDIKPKGIEHRGFTIRLCDPASLSWQAQATPINVLATTVALPAEVIAGESAYLSESAIQAADVIASSLRFAVREGIAEQEIKALLVASNSSIVNAFENLGQAISNHVCAHAESELAAATAQYREWCQQIGGQPLVAIFEDVLESLMSRCDFNFGLVRDGNGTSFGNESEQYRYRLFTSPDLELLVQFFQPEDLDQIAIMEWIYTTMMPFIFCISQSHFHQCNPDYFWEELDVDLLQLCNRQQIIELRELVGTFQLDAQDRENFGLSETQIAAFCQIVNDQGKELLERIAEIESYGYYDMQAALLQLCDMALMSEKDDQLAARVSSVQGLMDTLPLAKIVSDDPTFFSHLLAFAEPDIRALKVVSDDMVRLVIDHQAGSDVGLQNNIVIRYFEDLQLDDYSDTSLTQFNELLHSGDMEYLFTCINLNEHTIEVMKHMQRSVVLLAALTACSSHKENL